VTTPSLLREPVVIISGTIVVVFGIIAVTVMIITGFGPDVYRLLSLLGNFVTALAVALGTGRQVVEARRTNGHLAEAARVAVVAAQTAPDGTAGHAGA
jgi:hypothetical protein